MRSSERHYSIGAVGVSIRSDCRPGAVEYRRLYAPYLRESPPGGAVEVEIRRRPNRRHPWRPVCYAIGAAGVRGFEVQGRRGVLPHLEWCINLQVIRTRHDFVQFHAASLEIDGRGLILPGHPGSGKSTLAAGLLARGWSYLCDEFALVDPGTRLLQPFPRALCMKEASFAVVDRLGLPLARQTPYQKSAKGRVAFLNPLDIRPDVVGRPCPVRWVVFPTYAAGAAPALLPMSRAEAAYELARQCFNFRNQAGAMAAVADLVRGAECYRLISGEIFTTCDLVETLRRLPVTARRIA